MDIMGVFLGILALSTIVTLWRRVDRLESLARESIEGDLPPLRGSFTTGMLTAMVWTAIGAMIVLVYLHWAW